VRVRAASRWRRHTARTASSCGGRRSSPLAVPLRTCEKAVDAGRGDCRSTCGLAWKVSALLNPTRTRRALATGASRTSYEWQRPSELGHAEANKLGRIRSDNLTRWPLENVRDKAAHSGRSRNDVIFGDVDDARRREPAGSVLPPSRPSTWRAGSHRRTRTKA
jgi:hypothetical protein